MRIYTVHLPPWTAGGTEDAVFLREGFAWLGALFGPFWALAHGLWITALALIAGLTAITLARLLLGLDPATVGALGLGYFIILGFSAQDLRRRALKKRGYRFDRVIAARNRVGAELRYFSSPRPEAAP